MKSRWKEINRFPLSDPLKSNIPDTKIDRVKYFFLSSTVYTAYSLHSIQAYKRIKGPRLKLLFENRNNQLPDIIILQRSSVPWVFVKLQAIPVFHPNT